MLLMCGVLCATCVGAQVPVLESGVRTLVFRPGRTIRELLRPGDKIVTLVYDADTSVDVGPPPTPKEALRRVLNEDSTSALAVVMVTRWTTALNDDGTWIDTHVKAIVQDVLRSAGINDLPLKAGDAVEVRASGGEAVVDGVTVRTDVRPQFAVKRRYLLALGRPDAAGRRGNSLGVALAIGEQERLTALHAVHSRVNGVSLSDVRDVLRDRR